MGLREYYRGEVSASSHHINIIVKRPHHIILGMNDIRILLAVLTLVLWLKEFLSGFSTIKLLFLFPYSTLWNLFTLVFGSCTLSKKK